MFVQEAAYCDAGLVKTVPTLSLRATQSHSTFDLQVAEVVVPLLSMQQSVLLCVDKTVTHTSSSFKHTHGFLLWQVHQYDPRQRVRSFPFFLQNYLIWILDLALKQLEHH